MTERTDLPPTAGGSASSDAASSASSDGPHASRLLSDDRLARRAAKGDQPAFEEIYRRYHQSLFGFCLAMVGNVQDAQDALQNTMIKVLRALPGEKRRIKLKPWLYRIARNEAIETVRKRHDSAEIDAELMPSTWEMADTVEARERLRGLIADLRELPERQRAALVMRELAGLDFAQIANTLETSPSVVRQTVYEARLGLRKMEEGREMSCESVMRELSDADGRSIRRRAVRAHLRACRDCRAFRHSIDERRGDLAAIAPLPLAASAGILHGILGGSASAAAGAGAVGAGAAGGAGSGIAGSAAAAAAGKAVATSAIVKSAATVAVVATVGVTAADRGGVIDVPLPGDNGGTRVNGSSNPGPPSSKGVSDTSDSAATNTDGTTAGGDRGGKAAESGSGSGSAPNGRNGSHDKKSIARRARGKSKGRGQGRSNGPPEASSHGQQTATAHKSPNANPSPGSAPSRGQGAPAPSPSPKSPPREKQPVYEAPTPVPEVEPAPTGQAAEKGSKGLGKSP